MSRRLISIPVAVAAVIAASHLVIGDVRTAQYKGSEGCKMCHQIMNKDVVDAYATTGHAKALQKADAKDAIVADFASNPVFTKDKVAWVLGKGTREQAYLDAEFKVLPAKWDVKAKKWRPTAEVDGATQCIGCHTTGFDAEKKTFVEAGVTCEACHGPGSEHSGGDEKAIIRPKELTQAKRDMICGQCHSAGKDPSGKFAHPITFRPSEDLSKVFVDAKPTGPGRNQQYSEHITSLHAKNDVGCTVCHDPHNQVAFKAGDKSADLKPQLKQPVNEHCLSCHTDTIKDIATHAPTAAADATCATCHMHGGEHTFKKATE